MEPKGTRIAAVRLLSEKPAVYYNRASSKPQAPVSDYGQAKDADMLVHLAGSCIISHFQVSVRGSYSPSFSNGHSTMDEYVLPSSV
ncbi:hypothetical protein An13g03200 [Aspergillus niger]|uniref:Uncharacterized protein n=2 Tax=Aspergillus niger TaxID=5061 RepID=A2R216_ASPNC|nr:hypothetical protein An13g03200 [Aspergillus niger]CAK41716.1 hypothetical protein An13g03200 [Aspergillus niger]